MTGLRQDGVPRTRLDVIAEALITVVDHESRGAVLNLPVRDRAFRWAIGVERAIEAEASQLPASDALDPELLGEALITGTDHPDMDPLLEPESARFYAERIAAEYNRLRARAGEPSEPGGGAT